MSGLRGMGKLISREDNEPVKIAWSLEGNGRTDRGRPKTTWRDGEA